MPRTTADATGGPTTPQRIRQAAIALFAERGFHGTGIRDIATQAQTTLSSLYHHCGSKDDLLVDIMLSSTQPLLDAAQRVVAAFPSPATQLAMLIEQHVWAHATDRLAKLIADTEIRALTGERRENVLVIRDSYEALWREAIKQGNQTHAFDTPNPTVAAITLLEMCTSVSHWYRPEGSLPLDELCRLYADHGLALVRAATNGVPTRRAALTLPEPTHFLHG